MAASTRGLWVLLVLASSAGCRTPSASTASGLPQYEHLHLVYDVNSRFRSLPLTESIVAGMANGADLDSIEPVSPLASAATIGPQATDSAASSDAWKGVRLQIDYPHPEGLENLARATLRLTSHPEPGYSAIDGRPLYSPIDSGSLQTHEAPLELDTLSATCCDDELWTLDIPRQQLDSLLAELQDGGFFRSQLRPEVGTRLAVQIDGQREVVRNWTPEPKLDEFVHRVHTAGHLRGFVSCGAEIPPAQRGIAQMSWTDD